MKNGRVSAAMQSALVILLMTSVTGCEREKSGPPEVVAPMPGQQSERAMDVTQSGENQSMVVELGDLRLRLSEETKPVSNRPPIVMWKWEWPGLKSGAGRNRPRTPDDLSKQVTFRMVADERNQASKMAVEAIDNNANKGQWAERFSGPFVNKELRLLEYRRTNTSNVGMFYVADDKSITTPSGITMFAECQDTPMPAWGGYRLCVAGGSLSSGVGYSYEFTDRLLPEWRLLNSAINQFINAIVVKKN